MNRSVGAFFLVAALTLAAKSAAAQPAAILRGQVLEFRSEAPLTSVDIRLLDDRGRRVAGAITDGAGAFRFSVPRAGRYQLQSSSLGYASVTAPAIDLGLGDTIQVILHMAIDAVPLAPLEILARAKPVHAHSGLNAFADRARRQVGGRFLLRDQIDARSPRNVSDLLSTEGGVLVVGGGVFMNRLRCPPTIYLDGVKLPASRRALH